MDSQRMRLLVVVKAAPVLTRSLEETMCVAAIRLDAGAPHWIRLHPVPFRDLDDDSKFVKYQVISTDLIRPRSDRRPETWTPIRSSIQPGEFLDPAHGWAQRRHVIDQLDESTMCDLIGTS